MLKNTSQLLAVFFFLTVVLVSCKNDSNTVNETLFTKCWTHAFEEDSQEGILIFRPCHTHTFPAAHYRHTFTLKENEAAEYSVLAPNDAHTTAAGKWSYDPQSKKLRITSQEDAVVNEYEVIEINEDLLRLRE